MKILILSGGTGSVALQQGLWDIYGKDIDVKVLTNLYDNGKSTGTVRRVFDGKILGPSDLRKNQTLRHKLLHGDTPLLKFLDIRFDQANGDAHWYCASELQKLALADHISKEAHHWFALAFDFYFASPKASQVEYTDFSISNIIYAGLAAMHGYSLETAGTIMAEILEIGDTVIPNSDESVFLHAVTESGVEILDEGEIVDWNNPNDKIASIKLIDSEGDEYLPMLGDRAAEAIEEADIIILSSGTLWSSLIPTYCTAGFLDAFQNCKAKKYMVMNNSQDKDMIGVSAMDVIVRIMPKYFSSNALKQITYVFNTNASPEMKLDLSDVEEKYGVDAFHINRMSYIEAELGPLGSKRHTPVALVSTIMADYYKDFIKNETIVFDYDDTLVGRNNIRRDLSDDNLSLLWMIQGAKNVTICTGNSARSLNLSHKEDHLNKMSSIWYHLNFRLNEEAGVHEEDKVIDVYADGGLNKYSARWKFVSDTSYSNERAWDSRRVFSMDFSECLNSDLLFTSDEVSDVMRTLGSIHIDVTKLQNRNFATLSLKPIENEYRGPISVLIDHMLNEHHVSKAEYFVRPTGRTTIDISKKGNTKEIALQRIFDEAPKGSRITFVGDEGYDCGNDNVVKNLPYVDFLDVEDHADTLIFLKTLALTLGKKRA